MIQRIGHGCHLTLGSYCAFREPLRVLRPTLQVRTSSLRVSLSHQASRPNSMLMQLVRVSPPGRLPMHGELSWGRATGHDGVPCPAQQLTQHHLTIGSTSDWSAHWTSNHSQRWQDPRLGDSESPSYLRLRPPVRIDSEHWGQSVLARSVTVEFRT
jgi:hypothetical protein